MAGRIIGGAGVMGGAFSPIQRMDRSLIIVYGVPPDSVRDDDVLFTSWAIDPWPVRSGRVVGGEETGMWPITNRHTYVEDIRWTGSEGYPYFIRGFCYNSLGYGVGNVTVRLCRSSDDILVSQNTTGPDGGYGFGVYDNTTQYYITAYQAAPPLSGVSVRTLTGTAL